MFNGGDGEGFFGESVDDGVVGLGAAGGKKDFRGTGVKEFGDGTAGGLD